MKNTVVVKTFLHKHEAEMARGLLKDNDIQSVVLADDGGGSYPGLSFGSMIKLAVRETDAPKAKDVLKQMEKER